MKRILLIIGILFVVILAFLNPLNALIVALGIVLFLIKGGK